MSIQQETDRNNAAILTDRVRRGLPTIVVATMLPLPRDISVFRVRCDLPGKLGPLDRARDRLERFMDGENGSYRRPVTGVGAAARRLLEAEPEGTTSDRFVSVCNRLAASVPRFGGGAVLVLDGIDCADTWTHRTLARILAERPRRLLLPIVLLTRGTTAHPPTASFRHVVEALATSESAAVSSQLDAAASGPMSSSSSSASATSATQPSSDAIGSAMDGLDRQALRVLRAASIVGTRFESALVSRMLDMTEDEVLEALQRASDAGIPLSDDGTGHLVVPVEVIAELSRSVLPSLRARWQGVLANLLATHPHADANDSIGQEARATQKQLEDVTALIRSGDVERASEQLDLAFEAVQRMLPASPFLPPLRARAKLERARLRWLGIGHHDPDFSLDSALALACEARAELGSAASGASPALRADAVAVIAGIAYDLGDSASLEKAAKILAETLTSLLAEDADSEAALLLNDQAAIHLRMGHGARAVELLTQSSRILEKLVRANPKNTAAAIDLAETHHLIARLPLHIPAEEKSGVVMMSIDDAIAHALVAQTAFESFHMRRDVGRVMETWARLEAKRDNIAIAEEAFSCAMRLADEAGDLTGLARITAGFAELLAKKGGTPRQALQLLVSSIELNREKRSPAGLAFDERVLDVIARNIGKSSSSSSSSATELNDELDRARTRLATAIAATP